MEKKHYLVKVGVIVKTENEEKGKLLKFTQYGKNKTDALFNLFKEFNLLDVIKLDYPEAIKYSLVNYEINEIE